MPTSVVLTLSVVVKDVALADDLEVGDHASLLEIWNSDHPYLVDLLHGRLVWDWHLGVHPLPFQIVFEVVNIADLAWNGNSFAVESTDLAIVHESLVC